MEELRIWITGIAGFIGSHVADALIAAGHKVGGNDSLIGGDLENVPKQAYFRKFDCAYGNPVPPYDFEYCWKPEEFGVPDVVVHAAALAHEGLSSFSPYLIGSNIFGASLRTFSRAIRHGVKRIVFMSSMSRYGNGYSEHDQYGEWVTEKAPFKEWYKPNPADPYGIAKVAAEDALKVLCETHGVKWSIVVPHSVIGVRQRYVDPFRNVCSIMINRCLNGKPPIVYGNGSQKRSFSPISDCIPSLVKIVEGAADYEVVNIGPDKNEMTIWELAGKIISMTGFSGTPIMYPPRPNDVDQAYCSSDKARKIVGYTEKQSIDDCLKEMIADIKSKGPKPFIWNLPIEIMSEKCPRTWSERRMDV